MRHRITIEVEYSEDIFPLACKYVAKQYLDRLDLDEKPVAVNEKEVYINKITVLDSVPVVVSVPSGLEILGVKIDAGLCIRPAGDLVQIATDEHFSPEGRIAFSRDKIGALIDALRMLC